jgi:predicted O-methyltransferase YrrM
MGNLFANLVKKRKPSVIVEFGTAFGVSGMYWIAGLEANNYGELLTFEPNKVWAEIARKNLSAIGSRFQLVIGTFEENIDLYLGHDRRIDIAFIDAIHTSEFVIPQFKLVIDRLAPNGIILLDDINFSSDMASCWDRIALDSRVKASAALSNRVGIVELA